MAKFPRVIYKITHNVTGRMYIGSTGDYERRISLHFAALRSGRHTVEDMQSDADLYGMDFTVEIIDEIHNFKDFRKEYEFMNRYNSRIRGIGYNYKDNHAKIRTGYINAKAELVRAGLTLSDVSENLGGTVSTWSLKLNGKFKITLDEAKRFKKLVNTDLPLEILFARSEEVCQ